MLKNYPIPGWRVTHVEASCIELPDATRKARVLLSREGDEYFLIPTYANRFRIAGYLMSRDRLLEDEFDRWIEVTPRDWRPGYWPPVGPEPADGDDERR